jgi:hypothetical protein
VWKRLDDSLPTISVHILGGDDVKCQLECADAGEEKQVCLNFVEVRVVGTPVTSPRPDTVDMPHESAAMGGT